LAPRQCPLADGSPGDTQNLSLANPFDRLDRGGDGGLEMLHPIARGGKHHHADSTPLEVLLKLNALICGEKYGETSFCGATAHRSRGRSNPAAEP
jgi:hypothetical protein